MNNNISCGIFLDTSKAFGTIDYNTLLSKLSKCGIHVIALHWFKLLVRTLPVCVSGYFFLSIKKIECAVTQGPRLRPVLFLLYINDLSNVSSIQQFNIYSNDTNILYRDFHQNSLLNIVNQVMQKNTEWFAFNKLKVDANKSTAMLFYPRQRIIDTNDNETKINNATVPFSISAMFFGIYIDNNLTWNNNNNNNNGYF